MMLALRTGRCVAASIALAAVTSSPTAQGNHFILPCRDDCPAAATRYFATRIPQQPGYNTSAVAINASGVIAGNLTRSLDAYGDEEDVAAFVFSADNTLTQIPVPGSAARAYGINNQGEIVGSFQVNGQSRAFRFGGGVTTELSLAGASDSMATAINDNGDVAGIVGGRAFVLRADAAIEFREESYAYAINASGQIAGFIRTSQSLGRVFYHAFRFGDGGMEDLGALGDYAYALGISAGGDVVGETFGSDNIPRPFIYKDGAMRPLGAMHGCANAINAAGNVVGYQFDDGAFRVFLYADGTIHNLGDLVDGLGGARLVSADAINDAGQIAARACAPGLDGECFGVRLDPVRVVPVRRGNAQRQD